MRHMIVGALVFSMTFLPVPSAFAVDQEKSQETQLTNVELNAAGKVKGRLVDGNGKPIADKVIDVRFKEAAKKVKTEKDGSFTLEHAAGGSCALIVDDRAYACRLWKQNTAPPKSLTSFGVVHTNGPIVRAQECAEGCDDGEGGRFGRLGGVSGGQLLGLGLLAGAVVAIVLAVEDDDDGS